MNSYSVKGIQFSNRLLTPQNHNVSPSYSNNSGPQSKFQYLRVDKSLEIRRGVQGASKNNVNFNDNLNENIKNNLIAQVRPGTTNLNSLAKSVQLKNNARSSVSPNKTVNYKKYLPELQEEHKGKKTLILDLDETLVHSSFTPFNRSADINIKIDLEGKLHDIYVLRRYGVDEFLERMSKLYEIVIFTASLSKYAMPLINLLDPNGYCTYSLYREHCTLINNAYVKNLKHLNRDLKNMLIVDNNPASFALNTENGIPIKSWYEDKNDRELINLIPILEFLANVGDVRDYVKGIVNGGEISYRKFQNMISSSANKRVVLESKFQNKVLHNSNSAKSHNTKDRSSVNNLTPVKADSSAPEQNLVTPVKKSSKELINSLNGTGIAGISGIDRTSNRKNSGTALASVTASTKGIDNKIKNSFLVKEEKKQLSYQKVKGQKASVVEAREPTTVRHINFNDLKLTKDMLNIRDDMKNKGESSGGKYGVLGAFRDNSANNQTSIAKVKNANKSSSVGVVMNHPSTARASSISAKDKNSINSPTVKGSQKDLKGISPSGRQTNLRKYSASGLSSADGEFKTVIQLESNKKQQYSSYLTNK